MRLIDFGDPLFIHSMCEKCQSQINTSWTFWALSSPHANSSFAIVMWIIIFCHKGTNEKWQMKKKKCHANFFCSKVPSTCKGYRRTGPQVRSIVWKHFRITYGDSSKVACDYCDSKISYKGGTTATMLQHLQRIHDIGRSWGNKEYEGLKKKGSINVQTQE